MAIRRKTGSDAESEGNDHVREKIEQELQSPKVQAVIHYVKSEYPEDVAYFTELVKMRPVDAVSVIIWKHHAHMQLKHEMKLRSIMRTEYEELAPEAKARVDAELAKHAPGERDRAFIVIMIVEKLRDKGISLDDDPKEGMGTPAG